MKNSTWGWRRRIARAAGAFAGVLLAAAAHAQETAPAAPRILALGDSLVAGFGLAAPDGFVAQLERALRAAGRDVTVLDGAVSGDTTAGGRARLAWALGDGVDGVIVELGANDALRGIDPASSRANLDAILARLADAGVPRPACRHVRAAQPGRRLCRGVRRHVSRTRGATRRPALPVLS